MQYTVYGNIGKSAVYPLLLDVTSDIIGQLNRRIVIPLLPVACCLLTGIRQAAARIVLSLLSD